MTTQFGLWFKGPLSSWPGCCEKHWSLVSKSHWSPANIHLHTHTPTPWCLSTTRRLTDIISSQQHEMTAEGTGWSAIQLSKGQTWGSPRELWYGCAWHHPLSPSQPFPHPPSLPQLFTTVQRQHSMAQQIPGWISSTRRPNLSSPVCLDRAGQNR